MFHRWNNVWYIFIPHAFFSTLQGVGWKSTRNWSIVSGTTLVLHHLELFNRSQSLFLSAFPQKTNKNHETSGPVWGSFGPVDWTVNFHFRIVLCCCWKFHVCWFCVHQFYINIARGFVYFGKKWLECINKNVWETIIQSTMFCTVCHR